MQFTAEHALQCRFLGHLNLRQKKIWGKEPKLLFDFFVLFFFLMGKAKEQSTNIWEELQS